MNAGCNLKFDVSNLPPRVHANKEYQPDDVRHFQRYTHINASSSGQYGRQNLPRLVKLIGEVSKGAKIYFVNVRQDTNFVLNERLASLKRIAPNDDNSGMTGDEVEGIERAVAEHFVGQKVQFLTRKAFDLPSEQWTEKEAWDEQIERGSIVKDFIESREWNGQHFYKRFALDENGPLTDEQVDEYLVLLDEINSKNAWLHTNSIIGDKAAILLILMKDMLENASEDSFDTIIERIEGSAKFMEEPKEDVEFRKEKIARGVFIKDFYAFAAERASSNLSWSDWKKVQVK